MITNKIISIGGDKQEAKPSGAKLLSPQDVKSRALSATSRDDKGRSPLRQRPLITNKDIINEARKIYYDNLAQYNFSTLLKNIRNSTLLKSADRGLSPLDEKLLLDWYKNESVNAINKPPKLKRKSDYFHITVPSVGFIVGDLMDYSKFFHTNSGNRYIFTCVDQYSKYAWAFPIKHKSPEDILLYLKKIHTDLANNKYEFKTFTCDDRNEFKDMVKK